MTNILNEVIRPIYDNIRRYISNDYVKKSLWAFLIIIPSYAVYQLSNERETLSNTRTLTYIFSIGIPFYIMAYVLMDGIFQNGNYSALFTGLFVVLFIAGVAYLSVKLSARSMSTVYVIMNIIISVSIIIGLAMIFLMFKQQLKSLTGMPGLIVGLIFYIPCFCIDFFNYLSGEIISTPKLIYYLFLAEIVLIFAYVYLPDLFKKIINSSGKQLLEGTVFLDTEKVIATADMLVSTPNDIFNKNKPTFDKNYAISMWVYLDNQAKNYSAYSKETVLFDYGNGKPKITYVNNVDDKNQKDKLNVYFTDISNRKSYYEITISKQKWNQIVFNYSSQRADLFINGTLERTFEFTDNLPTYKPSDKIVVGSNNGLDGAICNVKFYSHTLTKFEIANTYNLLRNKNPPVNI